MQESRFVLPAPCARLLGSLPALPGSWMFAQGLNLAIARQLPADVVQALAGKRLRLQVQDARLTFDFVWRDGAFRPQRGAGLADLTIAANAHDLMLLARRQEDPDTLFFGRRLSIEGDTELGLLFKNTLDAIDLPTFDLRKLAREALNVHLRPGRPPAQYDSDGR